MKRFIQNLLPLAFLALVFSACEEDMTLLVVKDGSSPALSATQTAVVLTEDKANDEAVKFTWTKPDYGFQAAVSYTIQVARKGSNFANANEAVLGSKLERSYTVGELNTLATLLGLPPGDPNDLEIRIKADIHPEVDPRFSEVRTLTVTPYLVVIVYPALYVPGSYQGWNPGEAKKIYSVKADNVYEGYVNFPDASTEFKFTDAPNWNNGIFGDASGGTSGNIASPGDNFKVAAPGYYRLRADLVGNVWTAAATAWGLIGSATPGAWDNDTDMTYDAATDTWRITLDLIAGEIKFRANDAWDVNFGDTGLDKRLEYGGDNIPVAEVGNYTIVLSIGSDAGGIYTYSVTKN